MINSVGFGKSLYILAFDHRASFVKKIVGVSEGLSPEQMDKVKECKQIIYEGFQQAVSQGIPKKAAAVLVDKQFGSSILKDAKQKGFVTILTTEKSGQEEFEFEYGQEFGEHIRAYGPTFAKALVRYNPMGDRGLNLRQGKKLKMLSDFCHAEGYKFLLEILAPRQASDHAAIAEQTLQQLQAAGVEPDIWKLEGFEQAEDYRRIVSQARSGGRDGIGVVILGRGEDDGQVTKWLEAGKGVEGVIGFAIGRTIFLQPLLQFKDGTMNRQQAIEKISDKYFYFFKKFADH